MALDPREQRGIIIAAMCRIDRQNGAWLVPSQTTSEKRYEVRLEGNGSCTCPDCEAGFVCKHLRAVRIVLKRELGMDGTITETKQILFEEKKTYTQDWPAYNAAQACEKKRLQVLLADLCRDLPEFERASTKPGPKPHKTRDAVFSMVFKVYCGLSSRRFTTDLHEAHERGHVTKAIPGVKVTAFFEKPAFTPILTELVAKSAAPLKAVESTFAVDSTGFGSTRYETWYDMKYGVTKRKCAWIKAHVSCGTKTNCITAVRVLEMNSPDSPQFKPLVDKTAETFKVNEVSADKAYLSQENFEAVADHGGTAFIPFKENSTGGLGGLFEKMFHYFQFKQDEFLSFYHKRSNVESVFSAVKRKFGDSVMSRTDAGMQNEALCKMIAHNLCCLIQEQHELGIEPIFWANDSIDNGTLAVSNWTALPA